MAYFREECTGWLLRHIDWGPAFIAGFMNGRPGSDGAFECRIGDARRRWVSFAGRLALAWCFPMHRQSFLSRSTLIFLPGRMTEHDAVPPGILILPHQSYLPPA